MLLVDVVGGYCWWLSFAVVGWWLLSGGQEEGGKEARSGYSTKNKTTHVNMGNKRKTWTSCVRQAVKATHCVLVDGPTRCLRERGHWTIGRDQGAKEW